MTLDALSHGNQRCARVVVPDANICPVMFDRISDTFELDTQTEYRNDNRGNWQVERGYAVVALLVEAPGLIRASCGGIVSLGDDQTIDGNARVPLSPFDAAWCTPSPCALLLFPSRCYSGPEDNSSATSSRRSSSSAVRTAPEDIVVYTHIAPDVFELALPALHTIIILLYCNFK